MIKIKLPAKMVEDYMMTGFRTIGPISIIDGIAKGSKLVNVQMSTVGDVPQVEFWFQEPQEEVVKILDIKVESGNRN